MTARARITKEVSELDDTIVSEVLDFIGYLKAKQARAYSDNPPMDDETREALEDVRLGRNLHGPYKTAEEAVAAMLVEDAEDDDRC